MAPAFSLFVGVFAIAASGCAAAGPCAAGSCGETDDPGLLQARATLQRADSGMSGQNFTFMSPDPQLLQWDSTFDINGYSFLGGWLNAPLFYDEIIDEFEEAPRVCLRVWGLPARQQPAKHGPILGHDGGPGSSVEAVFFPLAFDEPLADIHGLYDVLGINQRGIDMDSDLWDEGFDGYDNYSDCPFNQTDGGPALPYPISACNEIVRKSNELCDTNSSNGTMAVPSMASCQAFNNWSSEVVPGFTADMNMTEIYMDVMPDPLWWAKESSVRWFYRIVQLNANLCFVADRFQLIAPSGRTYNTFNYCGTAHLAQDIDLLRQAVGSAYISIVGGSYGTTVGAVYATLFPDRLYRLLLSGVVSPMPDIEEEAETSAKGPWATWNGLAKMCDASLQQGMPPSEVCPLAPDSTGQLCEMIKAGGDAATRAFEVAGDVIFSVAPPALGMADLAMLANGQEVPYDDSDYEDDGEYPLLDEYSVDDYYLDSTPPASVHGLDTAGRLAENDFVSLWARLLDRYPIGADQGLWYAAVIGTWPAIPRPVPPMQSANRALIQGNLWDPQTGYANAQLMAQNFPHGSLMTWQGLGHVMQMPENISEVLESARAKLHSRGHAADFTNEEGKALCMVRGAIYLENGTLPRTGYVCPAPGYIPLGPAAAAKEKASMVGNAFVAVPADAPPKAYRKHARKRLARFPRTFGRIRRGRRLSSRVAKPSN